MLVGGAITLAAFALLGSALIEVGQWYEHRHNLQVRTDAAALAGGTLFNECFDSAYTSTKAANDMEGTAVQYSGIPGQVNIGGANVTSLPQTRSWQAGTPGNDGIGFQSNEFPTPGGGLPARDAFGADSSECTNLELDVKQTQQVPNLFPFSPLSLVKAWARVEEQQVQSVKPSLPLAIPNFDLSQLGVTFFDEATQKELTGCTGALAGTTCTYQFPTPPAPVTGQDGEGVAQWTLPPVTINLPTPSTSSGDLIGVRVSAGSSVGSCAPDNGNGGAGNNLYACFDLNQLGSGLVGIRDYPVASQTTPPLYEVMPSDSCSSDTSPYFSDLTGQSSCSVTLQAYIGETASCSASPPSGATLTATLPAGNTIVLTRSTCSSSHGTGAWLWSGSTTLGIDAASPQSEYPLSLTYTTGSGKGSTSQTWNNVQRFTSGNFNDDGPVRMISLSSSSGNAYSAAPGPDTVGVQVVTSEAGISKQLVVLRAAHSGSSTAFMLCYGGSGPYSPEGGTPGIQDGMQFGCSYGYGINQNLASVDPCTPQTSPADCVPNLPRSAAGNPDVATPLNNRFGCGPNPTYPDLWPNYSTPGDKRAVSLVLTSYNAYSNGGKTNGKQMYPVVGFGDFYITGFDGDKCKGDDPPPPGASSKATDGDIWGYFIKYDSGTGIPSGVKCVPNVLGECVAALVR